MAHRRSSRDVRARRQSDWFSVQWVGNTLTVAGGTLYSSLSAAALALRPFTIVRTRLLVTVRSDQEIATEDQFGAIALAVVSDQAAAIGVTAIPTPITDLDSDLFFVHQMVANSWQFSTAVGSGQRFASYDVDSKAMRKVNADQDVVMVGEVDTNAGSGMLLAAGGRMLIKTH